MELTEIMKISNAVYSGMPINHTIFIGHNGIWRSYQSVICYFPFKTDKKSYSVNIKNLNNVLAKLEGAEYEFLEKSMQLKKENISVKLPYVAEDKTEQSIFRSLQKHASKVTKWEKVPSNMAACVDVCSKTISTNAIHGTLSCFSIEGTQILTSDNVSLSIAELSSKFSTCLLDKAALSGAMSIGPTKFSLQGKHLLFKNDDNVLVQIPVIGGNFPDFSSIIGMQCENYIEFDIASLGKIADISESLFEGTNMYDNTLKVIVKDGNLYIKNLAEAGRVTAKMEIDFKENFEFSIDSKTLQLLAKTDTKIGINASKIIVKSDSLKIITSVGE